jgi:hypothetical protein
MGAWVSHGSHQVVTDLGFEPHLGFKPILGCALDCEDPGAVLPACLLVEIKFGNSSRQIPLVPINNSSKSFCSQTIPIKIPLVPINNSSESICSHQVLKQF